MRALGVLASTTGDTQAPTVPSNLVATAINAGRIDLTWTASTDAFGVTGYQIFRNSAPLITTISTSYSDTTCSPSTFYSYVVVAFDAAGNNSAPSTAGTATTPANAAPVWQSIPAQSLIVGNAYLLQLSDFCSDADLDTLTFSIVTGTLPSGIALSGNRLQGTPTTAGQTPTITVRAADAFHQIDTTIAFHTYNADVTAPPVPTLSATPVSSAQVDLSWTASVDAGPANEFVSGIKDYRIYRDGLLRTTITSPTLTYSDTGLTASTSYSYRVTARDQQNNESAQSTAVVATTQAAGGNIINAANATAAAVNAAIASAQNGDTVRLPVGASATWTVDVALPATKFITLQGNGSNISLSGPTGTLTINSHATGNNRVTGFNRITRIGTGFAQFHGPIILNIGTGAAPILDRCTINDDGTGWVLIDINGFGRALIYQNDIGPLAGGQEAIHNLGNSDNTSGNVGWQVDVVPGSDNAVYIESNNFHQPANPSGFFGCSAIQSYYGARTVARYNTLTYCQIDQHGTTNNVGARWWECYENMFVIPAGGGNQDKYFDMRAGSGVVFNNHKSGGTNEGAGNIAFREEDSSVDSWSVGTGKNGTLDPAYCWGNDASMTVDVEPNIRSLIQGVKPGYTPYTYPHPLRV